MNSLIQDKPKMNDFEVLKEYLSQLRLEIGKRLIEHLFTDSGRSVDYNLWMTFNRYGFLGLKYK